MPKISRKVNYGKLKLSGKVQFVLITLIIEAFLMYIGWFTLVQENAGKCICPKCSGTVENVSTKYSDKTSNGNSQLSNTSRTSGNTPVTATTLLQQNYTIINSTEIVKSTSTTTLPPRITAKKNKSRIFCWIMTSKNHYSTRTKYSEDTWPPRCDEHFYFTDDKTNRTDKYKDVFANLPDGHDKLWNRTKAAMRHIYDNYVNDFDWFFKVDDDSYVIVENLRKLLNKYNGTDHHYFGYQWYHELQKGYHSGGAGYVLSQKTMKLLVESLPNRNVCKEGWAEDVEVGRCLQNLEIFPENVMQNGTNLFFPVHFSEFGLMDKVGEEKINSDVISMHYLNGKEMRMLDFFIYRFKLEPP